jgi:hypothetical protein
MMGQLPRISATLLSSLIAAAEAVPLHELMPAASRWASGVCE